jgi:hypothetical protein
MKTRKKKAKSYHLNIEVDELWYLILGQISQHQEGFIWLEVHEVKQ